MFVSVLYVIMLGVVAVFSFFTYFELDTILLFFQNALKSLIPNTPAYGTHPAEASQHPKPHCFVCLSIYCSLTYL